MKPENEQTETPKAVRSTDLVRPPEPPTNLEEWLWYVRRYESAIFVREKNPDGKWDSIALSELSPQLWAKHVGSWLEDGLRIPCRVRDDAEIAKDMKYTRTEMLDGKPVRCFMA